MNYEKLYDDVCALKEDLRIQMQAEDPDYQIVEALAACYMLQEYLAGKCDPSLE